MNYWGIFNKLSECPTTFKMLDVSMSIGHINYCKTTFVDFTTQVVLVSVAVCLLILEGV